MTTTKKKAAPSDPLVAATPILIEGKAFETGEKITGVSKDELDRAVTQRRVIRKSQFDNLGQPAPEFFSDDDDADGDADADDGDNGGSDQ